MNAALNLWVPQAMELEFVSYLCVIQWIKDLYFVEISVVLFKMFYILRCSLFVPKAMELAMTLPMNSGSEKCTND